MLKTKRGLMLAGIAAVLVFVFVILAFALGKRDDEPEEKIEDRIENAENTEEEAVEMISYEDGAYPMEKAMVPADSYDAIYEKLAEYYEKMYTGGGTGFVQNMQFPEVGGNMGDYDPQKAIVFTEVPDYADKKEDILVYDDEYVYLVKNDNTLSIVKLEDGIVVASISPDYANENEHITDLHVDESRLSLINSVAEWTDPDRGQYSSYVNVYTYDISNPAKPVLMGCVTLEGAYSGSRLTGKNLYVYTAGYKDGFISLEGSLVSEEELSAKDYVPSVNGEAVPAGNIYLPEKVTSNYYMTIAAIPMDTPNVPKNVKSFLSVASSFYAGDKGLYLSLQNGLYNVSSTVIVKVDFADGDVRLISAGSIEGTVIGTNGMCEEDGLLRVVSSVYSGEKAGNYLYELNEEFKIVSKSADLAKGEFIQSVRFIGDKLYLATYGEKPLVSVDLSDMGGLKETAMAKPDGFDGLLCAFGENKVLAISYQGGVRLIMFDTSDPSEIRIEDVEDIIADTAPAVTDSSALMLDVQKGLIGFSTEDWDEGYSHVDNFYRLYRYTQGDGFVSVLDVPLGQGNCWNSRGFVSKNIFYVNDQDAGMVKSYDIANGFAQIGEISY